MYVRTFLSSDLANTLSRLACSLRSVAPLISRSQLCVATGAGSVWEIKVRQKARNKKVKQID